MKDNYSPLCDQASGDVRNDSLHQQVNFFHTNHCNNEDKIFQAIQNDFDGIKV